MPADDDDATGAAAGDDTGGDEDDDQDDGSTVLLTVMVNKDGTYELIAGDEDEDEGADESGDDAEPGEDEGGEAGGGGEGEEGGGQPEGQTFDSVGALLKGILDLVKNHEDMAGGEGSADSNFNAGFEGGAAASPPKMAQKY